MMQPVIRKNHMDIAWHEYTDENGADIPVTNLLRVDVVCIQITYT